MNDIEALLLTLKLAGLTTLILVIISMPIAWYLARTRSLFKPFVQAIVSLPLVLPPTVLGFYLLVSFSPNSIIGSTYLEIFGQTLPFSFTGVLIGSVIFSLPFAVHPLYVSFSELDQDCLDAAFTMGLGRIKRFILVVLGMSKSGLASAAGLSFAHTVGEFGVVLMIGGNIPGETRVLSIALFDHVESFQYANAHYISLGLVIFSLVFLSLFYGRIFKVMGER